MRDNSKIQLPCMGERFKSHPQSEARKHSAITLIKDLLAVKKSDILDTHLKQLLSILLWKLTEAGSSKHRTRFRSEAAMDPSDRSKLRHDHVCQRRTIIAELVGAKPHEVDQVLANVIGCTVTLEEHARLSKFDRECDGWDRYRKAGIVVIDTQNGERVDLKKYSAT